MNNLEFILLKQSGEKQVPSDKLDEQGVAIMHTVLIESEVILPVSNINKITVEKVTNKETNAFKRILVVETKDEEEYDKEDFSRTVTGEIKFEDISVYDKEKKKNVTEKHPIKCYVSKTRNKVIVLDSEEMLQYYDEVLKNLVLTAKN